MSLHTVAKHVAAKGRGEDTQLVHMTPKEVQGLQALAMAHGGSLTVNPDTGLVEAGVLSKLLPTLLGFGLTAITGIPAWQIGMGVGGAETLRTGDLKKGLMAGLGAYGGAGLAGGLAGAGAAELGKEAATEAVAQQINPMDAAAWGSADTAGTAGLTNAEIQNQVASRMANLSPMDKLAAGAANPSTAIQAMGGGMDAAKYGLAAAAPAMEPPKPPEEEKYTGPLSKFKFDPEKYQPFDLQQPNPYYQAQYQTYAGGGPVEQMSNATSVGANTGYPMADINQGSYATPWQIPISRNMVTGAADTGVNQLTGEMNFAAGGGISTLGGYSDGGRMLKGPGDGMSDNIPAQIGGKQPARLADGEFVVPADVVSHLGNGSSDAGARQLYKMMDRIRQQRTGKKKQAPEVNPAKAMPA